MSFHQLSICKKSFEKESFTVNCSPIEMSSPWGPNTFRLFPVLSLPFCSQVLGVYCICFPSSNNRKSGHIIINGDFTPHFWIDTFSSSYYEWIIHRLSDNNGTVVLSTTKKYLSLGQCAAIGRKTKIKMELENVWCVHLSVWNISTNDTK